MFHLPGRRDVVSLEFDPRGLIRGIRQVSNPDKLTRVAAIPEPGAAADDPR
ncbi:MAG: hypothetical protein QM606_02300 [Leucobacter sp.]